MKPQRSRTNFSSRVPFGAMDGPNIGGALSKDWRRGVPAGPAAQRRHSSISEATSAVQPVWCEAPRPAPLSPWKYS